MRKFPQLYRIHSDETLEQGIAGLSLAFWRGKSNSEIIESLQPGELEALKIKVNGRIINGNVRCKILLERGFDINQLKFEVFD